MLTGLIRKFVFIVSVWGFALFAVSGWCQQVEFGFSPNPTGSGAQALGMGNAFVAYANDATAASWNPAGLLRMETMEASLALDAMRWRGHQDGAAHPEVDDAESFDFTDLNYASFILPVAVQSGDELSLESFRMAFSLSYLKQYNFKMRRNFGFETTQGNFTYDLLYDFDQGGTFTTLSPAIASEITGRLSVGLALNIWNDEVTHASSFTADSESAGTFEFDADLDGNPELTGPFTASEWDRYTVEDGYSFTLGALYLIPGDKWQAGLVCKP